MNYNHKLLGVGLVLFGFFLIWYTRKFIEDGKPDLWLLNLQGYGAAVMAFVIGILMLIGFL